MAAGICGDRFTWLTTETFTDFQKQFIFLEKNDMSILNDPIILY